MAFEIGQAFQARQTPWIIAGALALALLVALMGGFVPRGAVPGGADAARYETAAVRFAAANGTQSLRLRLDGQYPGPLRDTTIQRWRDPVDGTVCYIYLPIAVPHSAGPPGLVQYGQADIGSISCIPPRP